MDIQDYETVLAVCRCKSWNEAAFETYQVASTVSKRVSKVEQALGVRIFERGSRRDTARLTSEGEIIVPYLTQITELYERLLSYAAAMKDTGSAELSVGYPPLIGTTGETEILSRFRADHPDISVNHVLRHNTELVRLVCDGKLDCAFVFVIGDTDDCREMLERLDSMDIGTVTIYRCSKRYIGLSAKHPLAGEKKVSISRLQNEQFVFNAIPEHEDYDSGYMRYILPFGSRAGIKRMDFINKSAVVDYIAAGHGVLPTACIPPDDIPDIRFVETDDSLISSCICIYPRTSPRMPVRELLKYVRRYAEEVQP